MHLTRLLTGFGLMIALCGPLVAENKPKSPEDLAFDEFIKLRDDKEAKLGPARFQKLIATGVGFITQNPTHRRTESAITALANFGSTMRDVKDKSQMALRASWLPALKFELVTQRHNEKLSDDAHAAVAALEAAVAGVEARQEFSRDTAATYRDKIDALAAQPGGGRFLLTQEREYLELLIQGSPRMAEVQGQKLAEHADKKIAAMARDQLNLMEIRKQPYELKFTALDGREVDFEQLRGKLVLLTFWSAANEGSVKEQVEIKDIVDSYRKQVAVIGVAYDKAEDREKVLKAIKENKLTWPHHFGGQGKDVAFGEKLGVRTVPSTALFDQKGMLVGFVRANKLEAELKRLLGIK